MSVTQKIRPLLDQLHRGLAEREQELALGLLTLLAGESLFLLGPPGVAKSLLARRLKFAFQGAKSFEYLMGRFSTPEEIFGPLSIAGLRDRDVFERKTEGYLPEADLAFLDEIWRASPPIQNALLTILNEKVFRNGSREIKVPLKGLIGASNRLPETEDSAEAFWDRFLVRLDIQPLQEAANFQAMVTGGGDLYSPEIPESAQITRQEWLEFVQQSAQVEVPAALLDLITDLRTALNKTGYVSDRRWKKIVHLLKVCARLHGRTQVDLLDLFLMIPCLWNTPDQLDAVEDEIAKAVGRLGYPIPVDLAGLAAGVEDLRRRLEDLTRVKKQVERRKPSLDAGEYYTIEGFDPLKTTRLWAEDWPLLEKSRDLDCEIYFFEAGSFAGSEKLPVRRGEADATIKIHGEVFTLTNHTVWEDVLTPVKPDPVALAAWKKAAVDFLAQLEAARKTIETDRAEREQAGLQHLFTPQDYLPPALSSLDRALDEVDRFSVSLASLVETGVTD